MTHAFASPITSVADLSTDTSRSESARKPLGTLRHRRRSRRDSRQEYALVSVVAFAIFLVAVLFVRPLPSVVRHKLLGAFADGGSIFAQARAMTNMVIPIAFMV